MEESGIQNEKIITYEHFLNEKLTEDLRKVLEQRDKIFNEVAEYLQLRTTIEQIKDTDFTKESLKTKVDLGCNFYVQADIPDASSIYVCVGYGFYVQFTHPEALKFISKKTEQLTQKAELLTKDAARIKAHIKLVLEGLRELQHLNTVTQPVHRDVL